MEVYDTVVREEVSSAVEKFSGLAIFRADFWWPTTYPEPTA